MPTAVQDPDPFEGECAQGQLVCLAGGVLLLVESAGPEGLADRLARPRDEGLAEECWATPTPVYSDFVAATVGDRSDPGILLEVVRFWITLALLTEGRQQTWREDVSRMIPNVVSVIGPCTNNRHTFVGASPKSMSLWSWNINLEVNQDRG
ncbi:MAG: hypothetical protein L0H29_02310 [Sinobacteraceae bacterium]|nr:hypothetical protein [Nevskiaceae bacterium]